LPTSRPRKLSKKSIRYLKAQEEKGKHLGFENLRNIIYTGELEKHPSQIAARIANRTAGTIAISKGRTHGSGKYRNSGTIPVARK